MFKRINRVNPDVSPQPISQSQPVSQAPVPQRQYVQEVSGVPIQPVTPAVQSRQIEQSKVWELGEVATQTAPVFINNQTGEKIVDTNEILLRILNKLEE